VVNLLGEHEAEST
jgi:hypothetical protein